MFPRTARTRIQSALVEAAARALGMGQCVYGSFLLRCRPPTQQITIRLDMMLDWKAKQTVHRGWARRQAPRPMRASPSPAFHPSLWSEGPRLLGTHCLAVVGRKAGTRCTACSDLGTRCLCVQRHRCTARPLAPKPPAGTCRWHVQHCTPVRTRTGKLTAMTS